MERCENHASRHTNLFVTLSGIPYVLAEYIDKNVLAPIDRSYIKSDVSIDQSESMRAVIDISIDDIGKRASDGLPAIVGNVTKYKKLLNMIKQNSALLDHEIDTMRRGIIVRVNYQLESSLTGNVIKSMTEDIKILDRNYFLDINPRDVDDAGIVVNFSHSTVSTINQFTHGRDKMMFRITSVNLFYEAMKRVPKMSHIKNSMSTFPDRRLPDVYCTEQDYYYYHDQMQNHHIMGCDHDYMNESIDHITPPSWSLFNRFYHFDNKGKDIVLHTQEINDPMSVVALVPCGTARVNKTFMINPGHRIIFKFSIWKNDVTLVNDSTMVAKVLKAPFLDGCFPSCDEHVCEHDNHHHNDHSHHIDLDYEKLMRTLEGIRKSDIQQNHMINQMADCIKELQDIVRSLIPKDPTIEDPDVPPIVVDPSDPDGDNTSCGCNCGNSHEEIDKTLEDLQNQISDIKYDDAPIPNEMLKDMVDEAMKGTK